MLIASCCDAPIEGETCDDEVGVCSACGEWSEIYDDEEDE